MYGELTILHSLIICAVTFLEKGEDKLLFIVPPTSALVAERQPKEMMPQVCVVMCFRDSILIPLLSSRSTIGTLSKHSQPRGGSVQ